MPNRGDTILSHEDGGLQSASQTMGSVNLLLQRFPHVQVVSLRLLMQHEAFRELCEEYEVCTRTAENLARSGSGEPILREYKALLLRLEAELLGYISQHGGGSAS
jgi:hypothetical protein